MAMKVYWLEKTGSDVPDAPVAAPNGRTARPGLEWLNRRELEQFDAMRFAKRRGEWRLGRWTAKQAVAACLGLPTDFPTLVHIEVRPASSGAPQVFVGNKWAPVTISISHRAGRAVCAVAPGPGALGCDLELIEPHSEAFIADYFTIEEQSLVARASAEDQPALVTLLWSAKESALKALHAGLRLDTRSVIVTPTDGLGNPSKEWEDDTLGLNVPHPDFPLPSCDAVAGWHPLQVCHVRDRTFLGWWQQSGDLLRTMVAAPSPDCPILLENRLTPFATEIH
jgi:4'-phosphopantetheinyl transferase